jgi:hypothetical protein
MMFWEKKFQFFKDPGANFVGDQTARFAGKTYGSPAYKVRR